jgi:hypothetical protein
MNYILTDFLISLADVNNLKNYFANPDAYMTSVGLSASQIQAVKEGDLYKIRRYSSQEMKDVSLHARLLNSIFEEKDPHFKFNSTRFLLMLTQIMMLTQTMI